ncbi:ATP-binding response regulator [Marinobacter sp. NSM]|uniref:ATP-binding response regulator n=1 Tax=Marinobacter sp. NSM TaxID=3458004 RepID=UPI00403717FC
MTDDTLSMSSEILVVDDSRSSLIWLAELLSSEGHRVICARSGAEALSLLETLKPDLVLLDVSMPDISGIDLCRTIKSREEFVEIPVIFQSVHTDSETRIKGLRAGAADFLSKPYQQDEILLKVGIHLKIHSLQTQLEQQVETRTKQLTAEIVERRRIEADLIASKHELRALALHLQTVREQERKRIAREIHDELGQTLSLAKIELRRMMDIIPEEHHALVTVLESTTSFICQASETARAISENLRPGMLDVLGLGAALENHFSGFSRSTGIECKSTLNLPEPDGLNEDQATTVFRVIQECLTNIAKHAEATLVRVNVDLEEKNIFIIVEDNGRGFNYSDRSSGKNSLGLIGMRERVAAFGGDLRIEGRADQGTTVKIFWPLEN